MDKRNWIDFIKSRLLYWKALYIPSFDFIGRVFVRSYLLQIYKGIDGLAGKELPGLHYEKLLRRIGILKYGYPIGVIVVAVPVGITCIVAYKLGVVTYVTTTLPLLLN